MIARKAAVPSTLTISEYNEAVNKKLEAVINRDLTHAIASGEIEVWMQPQLNYLTGEIIGAEALCRWNHAEVGAISPGEFVPVLERSGRISELDRYVWEVACEAAHFWQQETGTDPLPFSVNVSRKEILDPDLPDHFIKLQERYQLPPRTLHLEVTETAYTADPAALVAAVTELRDRGFVIEMDDFGRGYSSLNMLRNLPVDVLKLDMGFLHGRDGSASDGVILQSVIRMAHGLGLPVIAEGVETLEQADTLKTMGCRFMQGYYFSRPMPVDQFHAMLNRSKTSRHSFAWAHDDLRLGRLLDRKSDTSFFFNNCIGGAIVFAVQNGRFETMLVNNDFFKETGLKETESDVFHHDLLHHLSGESKDLARKTAALTAEVGDGRCVLRIALNRRWIDCITHLISSSDMGDVMIAHVRDVTEDRTLERKELQLQHATPGQPERDPLTGLTTRHSLDALISSSLGQDGGSLFIVSIDDYHGYEYAHGREQAEMMLERFASLLRSTLGRTPLLARYGGGVFAVFAPGESDIHEVRAMAGRIIEQVRTISLGTKPITCSIGVATETNNRPESVWRLYSNATKSLYLVELHGGDSFFHHDMMGVGKDARGDDALAQSLRHTADGELLPGKDLTGTDLFSIISHDFLENNDWDVPEPEKDRVRDTVFGALRYASISEIPGILSFDYNPVNDTIFFESVDRSGEVRRRSKRGFHEHLFEMDEFLAEESMARLSALLTDLKYLPATGNVDLKCRMGGDEDFRWYRFSFTCLRDEHRFVIRGLGYGEDIDSAREASAWWKDRALHDGLTGVLNREGLEDAIEHELKKRAGGTMFLVDVDDFKLVNEQLGHLTGDSVLCTIADTLRCLFRESDIVGRYGADEMVVFSSGVMDVDYAKHLARELLDELEDIEAGSYGHITASIGVAILSDAPEGFYDFLEVADHATFLAKKRGKDCFTVIENGEVTHHIRDSVESHHTAAGYRHIEEILERNHQG